MSALRLALFTFVLSFRLYAQGKPEPVDFQQRIGEPVPRSLLFHNEEGKRVTLGSLLTPGQPVILSLAYFHCQTLCPLVLNGIIKATNDFEPETTRPFQVVVVSIDPRDTAHDAAERRNLLLARSGSLLHRDNLHVLIASEASIQALADAAGFRYRFDARTGQYQHPSGLVILTGDGRISRYFFGIDYDPQELSQALQNASRNSLGQALRQLVLACYRYNAETGTYTLAIYQIMRFSAVILVLGGGFVLFAWERRRWQPK